MWQQVDVVLQDAKGILDELQAYKGAGVEIREVWLLAAAPPSCAPLSVVSNSACVSRPSRTPTMRRCRSRRGLPWFPWWAN